VAIKSVFFKSGHLIWGNGAIAFLWDQKPGFYEKPGFLSVRVDGMSVLAQEKKPGWQKTWFLAKNRVSVSIPSPLYVSPNGASGVFYL
jgi:hypothetical protein